MGIRTPNSSKRQAFTLVEVMTALTMIGFMATVIIYAFLVLNKAAARQRDLTNAKALCQERIEEALSVVYDPPNSTIPALLTAGTTTTDNVQVYLKQDNTTVVVPGSRTVTVATADATLKLLRVTAQVTYTYQGRNYSTQLATLRAPD